MSSSESKFGFLADDSNTIFAEELNEPLERKRKLKSNSLIRIIQTMTL